MKSNEKHSELEALTAIDQLVNYALQKRLIEPLDIHYCRNLLLDLFSFDAPEHEDIGQVAVPGNAPYSILDVLLDYAEQNALLPYSGITGRDLFDARIMGVFTARPSETAHRFYGIVQADGIRAATADFYRLCIDSHYIRMDRIRKNQEWLYKSDYGALQITVNLSKPEKDPQEIAELKNFAAAQYPLCMLCEENIGYAGSPRHPARQNHRMIPLELGGEAWYFQYSPYLYYNEHSIVLNSQHVPMKLTAQTFSRLLEFVGKFPHYFIGSNADLPIVGGSILNHDHYQAGRHRFPIEDAPQAVTAAHKQFPRVKAGIVKWPMSVVRLSGSDETQLMALANHVFEQWKAYTDPEAAIFAFSDSNGERIPHNTVTPIARRNDQGDYEIDLVLRNNRTNAAHPEGIFHPHRELHHIKKENIGLIEVMGLAILPGRLKTEMEQIADILLDPQKWDGSAAEDASHPLNKHAEWITRLLSGKKTFSSREKAVEWLQRQIGDKFSTVLEHAGVFKSNREGRKAFEKFMRFAGFELH